MEEIGGRVMNCSKDYIIDFGKVLHFPLDCNARLWHGSCGKFTRPVLFSTQTAFFLWSTKREPATIGVMDEGGTCRRPGPSFRGPDGVVCMGRMLGDISSPGRTRVCAAICAMVWAIMCQNYSSKSGSG